MEGKHRRMRLAIFFGLRWPQAGDSCNNLAGQDQQHENKALRRHGVLYLKEAVAHIIAAEILLDFISSPLFIYSWPASIQHSQQLAAP